MPDEGLLDGQSERSPRQPLGHLSRLGLSLTRAADVDGIVRSVLRDVAVLPQVRQVGLGLVEGGGRRLQVVTSDSDLSGALPWSHIDAYDDVPLTAVVRTGEPVLGPLAELDKRFADTVLRARDRASVSLAALPLPGAGSPIGGLLVLFAGAQSFPAEQVQLLEATARRTAEALQRVRASRRRLPTPETETEDAVESSGTSRILLEDDPRAASMARRFLREALRRWELSDEVAESAQLCLSEIVTNAYLHAGTPAEVEVTLQGRVLSVVVRDYGGEAPADAAPVAEPDPLRVHGRGLLLVDALSTRWGSERDAQGMTVWFVIELDVDSDWGSRTG